MTNETDERTPIRSARITRYRDSTPCGAGVHLTGDDLKRLGIDPVAVDVVDFYIEDGRLELEPGEGEPVIIERPPLLDPSA